MIFRWRNRGSSGLVANRHKGAKGPVSPGLRIVAARLTPAIAKYAGVVILAELDLAAYRWHFEVAGLQAPR